MNKALLTNIESVNWPNKEGVVIHWRNVLANRELFQHLVLRNIKARYTQSVLGIYWAIINPLLMALVLSIAFSIFVRIPTSGTPYVLFVLCGLLPWNFLAHSLTDATQSLVAHANLITKVPFPRELLPASDVAARLVDFFLSAVILLILLPVFGNPVHLTTLWVPVLLLIQLIFTLGLSILASMANLFFRDIRQLVGIGLILWMYLTPVIYPVHLVPSEYLKFYMLNPMASLVSSYRNVILEGTAPDWGYLIVTLIISLVLLVAGYVLFKKKEPLFAERV